MTRQSHPHGIGRIARSTAAGIALAQFVSALAFCGAAAVHVPVAIATEPFVLENDVGETARFDFFDSDAAWFAKAPIVPSRWVQADLSANVQLPDRDTVAFRYTTLSNRQSDTILWRPHAALASSKETPPRVSFKGISQRMVSESRTRTYTVTKNVPETRTRTVRAEKYRFEQKTRRIREHDPVSGQLVWRDQTYTVRVPYTEEVQQTYTVQVPVAEERTSEYTVMVPQTEAVFKVGENTLTAPLLATEAVTDRGRRSLGVTLADVDGVLVRGVEPRSPATRMTRFGPDVDLSKRYALEPNKDRIVRINGNDVTNVAEAVAAVQSSPAICILTVRNTTGEQSFEAVLDVRPAAPAGAPAR